MLYKCFCKNVKGGVKGTTGAKEKGTSRRDDVEGFSGEKKPWSVAEDVPAVVESILKK